MNLIIFTESVCCLLISVTFLASPTSRCPNGGRQEERQCFEAFQERDDWWWTSARSPPADASLPSRPIWPRSVWRRRSALRSTKRLRSVGESKSIGAWLGGDRFGTASRSSQLTIAKKNILLVTFLLKKRKTQQQWKRETITNQLLSRFMESFHREIN